MANKSREQEKLEWLGDNVGFVEAWEGEIGKSILKGLVSEGNKKRLLIATSDLSTDELRNDIVEYHVIIRLIEQTSAKINKFKELDNEQTKKERI